MTIKINSISIFLTMILTYSDIPSFIPATLKGRVTDASSNQTIPGAHVFIIEGEEEAFTNSNGEFSIKTWQKLPVNVTVRHKRYANRIFYNNTASKPLEITLVPGQPK